MSEATEAVVGMGGCLKSGDGGDAHLATLCYKYKYKYKYKAGVDWMDWMDWGEVQSTLRC